MFFTEHPGEAARISSEVLARMRAEGVTPIPEIYTMWYGYYCGRFPDLTRAVDIIASNRQPFSDERCVEIYRRFFGTETEEAAVRQAGERLQTALQSALGALTNAGADVAHYGDALAAMGGNLGLAATIAQIKSLVQSVAAETSRMAERNRTLQAELSDSSSKIEAMRRDLDTVRQEALTDGLTGIANRKRFDQTLRESAAAAMENDRPLSLLLIDIDHFKKFNDTHGHTTGDQVLKLVARTLSDCVRGCDLPARFGGEEFAIVMPDTALGDAMMVAERIRSTVAGRRIIKRTTGETLGNITLSAGLAQYRPGESMTTLIQRADAALYSAKGQGRNRVVATSEDRAA